MRANSDKTMEEVRRIKDECSLRYLSQTQEERDREDAEILMRAEVAMGKPIVTLGSSWPRAVAEDELAPASV